DNVHVSRPHLHSFPTRRSSDLPLQLRQQNPNVLTTCHASPSASTTPPAGEPATLPSTTTRSERPLPQVRAQSPAPWTTKPLPPRSDPHPSHRPPHSDASCPTQTGCAQDHPTPSTPSDDAPHETAGSSANPATCDDSPPAFAPTRFASEVPDSQASTTTSADTPAAAQANH